MARNYTIHDILRTALGIFLIFYALNKFFHFLPASYGAMPDVTEDFLDAVASYLPALYIFEIIIGLFLIFNKWTPFILIVLFPLTVAFIIFSISNGDLVKAWPAFLVGILNVILLIGRKDIYKPLFN
ncbi:MAG: DoxX family membrane protein [Flavobacteriaceae bacterium]|nr:DoxX family membrane protein [Flavobacteriaceae bacterium]